MPKDIRGGKRSGETEQQNKRIKRFQDIIGREKAYSDLKFSKNRDKSISFSYKETKIQAREHGGKMISPEKADLYKVVISHTGKIMPDGLVLRNLTTHVDTLIKRGKR